MQRAGFTIIELLVLILIAVLIAAILIPARGGHGCGSAQLKDATQLRGTHQALFLWASNNDETYPLPSMIDVDNFTVPELGRAKDTTANIMSILNNEGFIIPELLMSPLENNERIQVYEGYEFELISGAVDPEKALWDPKLSADFTSEADGNISYAHLIPQGKRLDQWSNTYKAEEAILSNRGPRILSVEQAGNNVVTRFADSKTRTTKFFRSSVSKNNWWSGNVAYNDNHVAFVGNFYANNKPVGKPDENPRLKLPQDDGSTLDIHDVMFADEQAPAGKDNWREAMDANQFLGIFTTAGENREDFTAIWD